MTADWFEEWFESPYYRLLYQHRNEEEAAFFLENLLQYLNPKPQARFLDLACGTGRHAVFLASKNYQVTGLDISNEKINIARQRENNNLSFFRHDMRHLFRTHYFDYVLNLFTSFGYFKDKKSHVDTLINIRKSLTADGIFVLDFFNAIKVSKNLIERESLLRNDIRFNIRRSIKEGTIIKEIQINDGKKEEVFVEKVFAFTLADFQVMFEEAGLEIIQIFGNYALKPFDSEADRLLLMASPKS